MEIPQDRVAAGSIRAFVGIGIPEAQRNLLAGYLDVCRGAAPELRWVRADSLHLTLRFLGQSGNAGLERLSASLRGIRVEPFRVRLGGLGSFGRASAVRVVWIGVLAGREGLESLAAAIEEACVEAGFPPGPRPYNPHLTLARARALRGTRVPELPVPPDLEGWRVDSFRLYHSRSGPGGAVYSVLEEFG